MYCSALLGCPPHSLILKVLNTPELKRKGFMGWDSPPSDGFGMLFVNDAVKPQSYHMHTVPFGLDCIGLDEQDCVVEVMTLNAHAKAPRSFSTGVKNVVEVRGGWAASHGLKTGDKLQIRLPI